MSSEDPDRLLVVEPGGGQPLWVAGHRIMIKATVEDTGGAFGLIESRAPVGAGPPLHIHHGVDESVWIVKGRVRWRCGERDFTAGPGFFLLLPREVPHTFLVVGDEEAVMLGLLTPGGSERYFADIGEPATPDGAPTPGPPDAEAVRTADNRWHTESVVGPPLSAEDG
ncbi:MAG: cupin domain-containing protein [Candidatus Dormibacteria bacterium]